MSWGSANPPVSPRGPAQRQVRAENPRAVAGPRPVSWGLGLDLPGPSSSFWRQIRFLPWRQGSSELQHGCSSPWRTWGVCPPLAAPGPCTRTYLPGSGPEPPDPQGPPDCSCLPTSTVSPVRAWRGLGVRPPPASSVGLGCASPSGQEVLGGAGWGGGGPLRVLLWICSSGNTGFSSRPSLRASGPRLCPCRWPMSGCGRPCGRG